MGFMTGSSKDLVDLDGPYIYSFSTRCRLHYILNEVWGSDKKLIELIGIRPFDRYEMFSHCR